MSLTVQPFEFLDPGPLVDGELELVTPLPKYIDDLLAACRHPQTMRDAPEQSKVTRQSLNDFLSAAPKGRHPGDPQRGLSPSYHFWMRLRGEPSPPVDIAGGIGLRIGNTPNIVQYVGHFGYQVYPPARGQHLAERACRLLLPLTQRHGLDVLWITCNPDNIASRRTWERLGATLVDISTVPKDHELYARGDHQKCRYRLDL